MLSPPASSLKPARTSGRSSSRARSRRSSSEPLAVPRLARRWAWPSRFGGIATALTMMAASMALWVMTQPGLADNSPVLQALYWLTQGFGGAAFYVPFGLLVAGVTIPAAFMRVIAKWIVVLGIAVAICGELSWLYMTVPGALPLVPLTRFPGFVWIIAVGLALPSSAAGAASPAPGRA